MKETEFRDFLQNDKSIKSAKAIESRIAKLKDAENILCLDAEEIVQSDDLMFESLNKLKLHEDTAHGVRQNALRKYYNFRNHKDFPKIEVYKK